MTAHLVWLMLVLLHGWSLVDPGFRIGFPCYPIC